MNPEFHLFQPADGIPNSRLPLILVSRAMAPPLDAGKVQEAIRGNGW